MTDHTLPLLSLQPHTREIHLSKGEVAIVDAGDYDYLSQFKWQALEMDYITYAVRHLPAPAPRNSQIRMHREILGINDPNILVDHIDWDGLNNTRLNLRIATHQQNMCNKGPRRDNKTGYKGVSWNKDVGKYQAHIRSHGKSIYLGLFSDLLEAALAYDVAAHQLHGEFAHLNFPKALGNGAVNPDMLAAVHQRLLTVEEIWQIRELFAINPSLRYKNPARQFGVTEGTISKLVRGVRHAEIPNRDGSPFEPIIGKRRRS